MAILISQSTARKAIKPAIKKAPIKSYIYYAPTVTTVEKLVTETRPLTALIEQSTVDKINHTVQQKKIEHKPEKTAKQPADLDRINLTELPTISSKTSQPKPLPSPSDRKLDSFTQLQRLRSKLNKSAAIFTTPHDQRYQAPSVFNKDVVSVPHSIPLKDKEKEREKNTNNIGAGIAITKGDDGRCSITQDMGSYGLSEGSSTQYFSCGETKFDKSFREHMQKVKAKLGKN